MKIFGDTAPLHDKQPLLSFVEVYVADKILRSEVKGTKKEYRAPEYIQSFEFNKLDVSGQFTLVLFDKNWTELEETFNLGAQDVKIRYGYVTGKQSALYKGIVSDYTVQYVDSGVLLGVNGIISNAVPNTNLVTLNTGSRNPTTAVKAICRSQGWKLGKFDETKDVSLPNSDYFSLIKEHPISYVNLYIAPYARRKSDGMSGFRLIIDPTTTPNTAHFLPLVAQDSASKTYVCQKGINSSVISFDVTAKGVFGGSGMTGSTTRIQLETIDPITGEVTSSSASTNEVVSTTGKYTFTLSNQEDVGTSGGMTADMASSSANYNTSLRSSIPFEGTLTILGDPSIAIGNTIRIIVPTSRGDLHLSSGKYMVKSIAESVSNGKYLTSLSVVRTGIEDGLELLKYKELVK